MNTSDHNRNSKVIEADETTTGVEMHKDSRFSQSWQNFKDSNPVMNKFVDYRLDTRLNPQFNRDSLVSQGLSLKRVIVHWQGERAWLQTR